MAAPMKTMSAANSPKKYSRKRPQEEVPTPPDDVDAKKQKKSFTEIDFKFHLTDPSTVLLGKVAFFAKNLFVPNFFQYSYEGFEKFVEAATDWSSTEEGDDIVFLYCRSSPDCEEVLQVLATPGRKPSELQHVFACLEKILLRVADDLGKKYYTTGQTIVRKLLTVHAGLMHRMLSMKNKSSQIKSALKLLVAMVMLGIQSAKLVMTHMDLAHDSMLPLLKRRDTKDAEDVRTCFIHLVLAFLLSGDSDTVRRLVQTKGLMEAVFHGVQYDKASTLQLLLPTILEKVLLNPGVSKTAKVHMLSRWSLKELAQLFCWKGPALWKDSLSAQRRTRDEEQEVDVPVAAASSEDGDLVCELVTQLLTTACTSYQHGIIFMDKTFGLSGRNQNHLMTAVLSHLAPHYSQEPVRELVTSLLASCPDQIHHFLNTLSASLVPRDSALWVKNVTFLNKIYARLQREMVGLKIRDVKSPDQLVNILLVYTFPTTQTLNLVLSSVRNKSILNNYIALNLVRQFAQTSLTVLSALDATTLYSNEYLQETKQLYKASVLKTLPDVMLVFGCWDKVVAFQDVQQGENKAADIQTLFEHTGASLSDVLVTVEQVLCLYQDLNPQLLIEHPVILGKLLDGILLETHGRGTGSPSDHMTRVYLLKLLAGTDARRLPWSKKNSSGHTLLYQLLEMVTQLSADDTLSTSVIALVCKLLQSTGQFEGHRDDLLLWLQVLRKSDPSVLDLVAKVTMTYIHNPYPYMDSVSDLQGQVAMETKTTTSRKSVSITDVLKMDKIEIDDDDDSENKAVSTDRNRFVFCPMLLVAMEHLQKEESPSKDWCNYVSSVILHSFHLQVDPATFCKWVATLDTKLAGKNVPDYIKLWSLKSSKVTADADIPPVSKLADLQRSHPALSSAADSLLDRTRRHLLNLTYLVNCTAKDCEKAILKHVKTILKSIMMSISESLSDVKTSSETDDQADVLQFEKPSALSTVTSALRLVLSHPIVIKLFLNETGGNQSKKVSKVITDCVVCLMTAASKNRLELQDCMEFYYTKTEEVMTSSMSKKSLESVLDVLTVLTDVCKEEKAISLLRLLLNCQYTDDTAQSYQTVLEGLLTKLTNSHIKHLKLNNEVFTQLITTFIGNQKIESELLYRFLKKFPVLSVQCSEEAMLKLMSSASSKCRLLELLLCNNMTLTLKVTEMIKAGDQDFDALQRLPLVVCVLTITGQAESMKEIHWKTCTAVLKCVKPQLLALCTSKPPSDVCTDLLTILRLLLHSGKVGNNFQANLEKKLLSLATKAVPVSSHHLELLHLLYSQSTGSRLATYHLTCVQWLVTALEQGTRETSTDVVDKLIETLALVSEGVWREVVSSWTELTGQWPVLVKSLLREQLTRPATLKLLTSLTPVLYRDSDLDLSVTIATIVTMVTGHKDYQKTMFGEYGMECKASLVDLVCVLIELCPDCCHTDHVGVYLGAYQASLSNTDQKLLKLLRFYEKNEVSLTNFKPYIWGEKGVEIQALRDSLGPSLKQAGSQEVMNALDTTRLQLSITNFPLRRKLQSSSIESAADFKSKEECYDPCFLLPIFSYLLGPASVTDCRKFVETGCLGYTLAGLSSHDEDMRCAALHVIDAYQTHLSVSKIPEKEQLGYFLELLQNSLPSSKFKLSSIITQFLAKTAILLLKPDEHMYVIMNNFLLLKPVLDTQNIPEFFKLFNSSDMQYKTEQSWILSLLGVGLRETADYRIFERRFTFKLVLSFYDSVISDYQMQLQVLEMLLQACRERSIVRDICQNHGFLVWLNMAATKLVPEKVQMVTLMTRLVATLWSTLQKDRGNQSSKQEVAQEDNFNQSSNQEVAQDDKLNQSSKQEVGQEDKLNQSTKQEVMEVDENNQSVNVENQSKPVVSLSLCTQLLACMKNLLLALRDVGEPVHLQFTETLLSVMSHMSGLSHDSRGHLVQTVSHSDIFLLLLQSEKQWTQSTMTSAVIQNILNVLEINSKNLMAAGSKDKLKFSVKEAQKATNEDSEKVADDTDHGLDKTLESTTEQTGYSQTVSKTTVKPAITSAQSDRQKLSETILRVILAWKSQGESVSQLQNYVVDFVVLQWVLHHLHSETTADAQLVGAVIDMLNTNLLTDRNSMLIDTVLESGRRDDIMADLLRLYALVYDKCRDLDMSVIEPAPAARISRTDMVTKLNDVLLNVMKHKDGGIKMNADKSHQLYTAEVASVDVRKMFL